ncbi:MAG: GAF domain-containing protein [Pseudomonadota bacterium]
MENKTNSQSSISCLSAEQRYRAFLEFLPDPVFVFNLDNTVSYLNPAFEKIFGWSLSELEGKIVPFVPESAKDQTLLGIEGLYSDKVIHGFETQRLTKDGRLLDIVVDGAVFYDDQGRPAGQVITLRDMTQEKRVARINQALFRIANSLYQFRKLEDRLEFIIKEVQVLLAVRGASVILLDEEKQEFYFPVANYEDAGTGKRIKEIRFPVDKGVAGHVYRTGKPLIVPDTSQDPHFFPIVDMKSGYQTHNMLDVPIQIPERMIGVLCAVNKKDGEFDQTDVEFLSAIASAVAFPIENARINAELRLSYEEVQTLSRAKDRVIHHLSHELKTPVSVLSASLGLLEKKLLCNNDNSGTRRILERAQRSLTRILDIQYQVQDILRQRDYRAYNLLSELMDTCSDMLETLADEACEKGIASQKIRSRIHELFGPEESVSEEIQLDVFTENVIHELEPRFSHRKCRIYRHIAPTPPVFIPKDVLYKIIEGLLRNAIENTPDSGVIEVGVRRLASGSELDIRDHGVGITVENQKFIFESHVTTSEPLQYATRKPYDFHAGGKGFDLLRMKIFSERYHFSIRMRSNRCIYIPEDKDQCPGDIDACHHCYTPEDCIRSGGTTMTVNFI